MIFYSPATRGFYDDRIHTALPEDAVEVTEGERAALLEGEASGMIIGVDALGRPVLHSPAPLSSEQAAELERAWRDSALLVPCALRDRHRDEIELGIAATLTSEQFAELLAYIQQLRDWPQSELFPAAEHRPVPPAWYQSGE